MRGFSLNLLLLILPVTALPSTAAAQAGCTPRVQARTASRNLPHALHDQALESLPALYPRHEVLVSRRASSIGSVEYALVAYRESPEADSVRIMAVAVDQGGARAWNLDATCPVARLADGLVSTMEALGTLR